MEASYRSVWWCFVVNEPTVIVFNGTDPECPLCSSQPGDDLDTMHAFITRIKKDMKNKKFLLEDTGGNVMATQPYA